MVSDSVTNAPIPMAASNAKDLVKKKRANRSAKLKQCKLDARREQWLSQVKNKGDRDESNGRGFSARSMHPHNESDRSMKNLEIKRMAEENDRTVHDYSDLESPANSPTSHTSTLLRGSANFAGGSSGSSSGGSCSGSITEEDEGGDDGCLDDWEAMADALAATDDKQEQHNSSSGAPAGHEIAAKPDSFLESPGTSPTGIEISKPKPDSADVLQRSPANGRAWRADDAFRPLSLPNLSKQYSFPMNSGRRLGHVGIAWGCKNVKSAPSTCPICCEDLDFTDSSFLPCSCGFHICLFCHKRILEEDGRCPGCRKQYVYDPAEGEATLDGGSLTFGLARSSSMITRS